MRTTLIVLVALLIATPAIANRVVTVTATNEGDAVVRLDYSFTATEGEPNRIRAFALEVSVDAGTFDAISDYKEGESSQYSGKGYGIFPGSIDLTNPEVPVWNDPVAPDTDRGAEDTGLGTDTVILEMGSLYAGSDANAPPSSGTLCKLQIVDCGMGATLSIAVEDAVRGGIVLENPPGDSPEDVTLTGCLVDCQPPPTCWDATECPGQSLGDATCDGGINFADLFKIKNSWLKSYGQAGYNCCANFDHIGSVNFADLFRIKNNWLTSGYGGTGNQDCPPE